MLQEQIAIQVASLKRVNAQIVLFHEVLLALHEPLQNKTYKIQFIFLKLSKFW